MSNILSFFSLSVFLFFFHVNLLPVMMNKDVCCWCNCRLKHLQGDLVAGVTVALTLVPQSIAYAQIANLDSKVRSLVICPRITSYYNTSF